MRFPVVTPKEMSRVYSSYRLGFGDYTINERGDVGSWIRLSCIEGSCAIVAALVEHAQSIETSGSKGLAFSEYLPLDDYHSIIGAILKQGVERLDNVRQLAGSAMDRLLDMDAPKVTGGEMWQVSSRSYLKGVLTSCVGSEE